MRYFVYTIIAIVAAAIIAGFFIIGSPMQERLRRFDDERISNLQFIQSEILNYWINKGRLPEKLADLEDNIRGVIIPKDPQNGTDYEYKITGDLSFSLCADFATANAGTPGISKGAPIARAPYYEGIGQNWQHSVGHVCFNRTIDKDFYKPVKQR